VAPEVNVDRARDAGLVILLLAGAATYLWLAVDWAAHPAEDAAMLMRYARHWAAGEGIVWNVGEPPVDGATDFGFLAVVALLARLGLPLEAATRVPLFWEPGFCSRTR